MNTQEQIHKRHTAMSNDAINGFDSWEDELEQVHTDRGLLLERIERLEETVEKLRQALTSGVDTDWLESK